MFGEPYYSIISARPRKKEVELSFSFHSSCSTGGEYIAVAVAVVELSRVGEGKQLALPQLSYSPHSMGEIEINYLEDALPQLHNSNATIQTLYRDVGLTAGVPGFKNS